MTLSSPPESWRLFVVTGALYAAFTTTGGGISWAVNSGSGWSAAEPVGVTWGPPDTSWSRYTITNGSGWSAQVNTGQATSYPPAITALPSSGVPLAFAWTEPSGSIGYGPLTALGFEPEGTVPQAATNVSPALAFAGNVSSDGTLYVAWKGLTNDQIGYESIYNVAENGLSASNWSPQEFEPQAQTLQKPALTVSSYNLYAGWTDKTTDDLFYASAENPY